MKFPALEEGVFIERLNRFGCRVGWGGGEAYVHLPNSGRLRELLVAGRPVMITPIASPARRTRGDLTLVHIDGRWVSVDARLPSPLMEEALRQGRLAPFRPYPHIRREVAWQGSRLDFLLGGDGVGLYLEVKSCTLVEGGVALFPDAPTARGRHHLESLVIALERGWGAAVAFVVQREDARGFSPHQGADPAFAAALRAAAKAGVGVYAFRCQVSPQEMAIGDSIPVFL